MNRNFAPDFIRSKGCRDCGQRIYYNMAKHEFCDDDGSKGFIRHRCEKWKPSVSEPFATFEQANTIQKTLSALRGEVAALSTKISLLQR
jgi:hypothetical protein